MLGDGMGDLLALRGVSKSYRRGGRRLRVLENVSLELAPGELGAVVGSRAEGKTTLLKIAAGIEPPDAGSVRLDAVDLCALTPERRARLLGGEIAWLGRDGPGVRLEVRDYLGLPVALGRGGRREARRRASSALERVGAERCAHRLWEELSDWEQVLVGLARGVVCEPRLLVVDGIADSVSMRRTRQAGELLLAFARELGCGVLMSCTDLEPALIAERVWSLESGRLGPLTEPIAAEAEIIEFPRPAHADGQP
jgi:predicted ABC-type transport system involved in lysophospholipase L1 biosynthesis ATPase subunit